MVNLKKSCEIIVTKCLGIKPSENCLIIYDKNKEKIAKTLFSESVKISKNTKLIEIPIGKINGEARLEVAQRVRGIFCRQQLVGRKAA